MSRIPEWEDLLRAFAARHGRAAQDKINQATVAICGLGGLGSNIAIALARAGVGRLILTDFDRVDITNLHRQQYKATQLGEFKTEALAANLRENAPAEIAGYKVTEVTDYTKTEETGLPAANVLVYKLENNETVIVRPSGTEPKIKIYYTTLGKDLAEAQAEKDKLAEAVKPIMA